MCDHHLLRHVDPCHLPIWSHKFTEGIGVSARAAAKVQDSAALKLRWERKATSKESGGKSST